MRDPGNKVEPYLVTLNPYLVSPVYLLRKTIETVVKTKAVTNSNNSIPAPPPSSFDFEYFFITCPFLFLLVGLCCAWSLDNKLSLDSVSWKSKESPLSFCPLPLISSSSSSPYILLSSSQSKEHKNNFNQKQVRTVTNRNYICNKWLRKKFLYNFRKSLVTWVHCTCTITCTNFNPNSLWVYEFCFWLVEFFVFLDNLPTLAILWQNPWSITGQVHEKFVEWILKSFLQFFSTTLYIAILQKWYKLGRRL